MKESGQKALPACGPGEETEEHRGKKKIKPPQKFIGNECQN